MPKKLDETVTFSAKDMGKVQEMANKLKGGKETSIGGTGKSITVANDATHDFIYAVMKSHHPELLDAGVSVTALMVLAARDKNGDAKGPAIKFHGYPAVATIKITNNEDRVAGLTDCVINIDSDRWDELSKREREALISHELTHLEYTGKMDNNGRPKLKLRLHDVQIGVFLENIKEFGDDSLDKKQIVGGFLAVKEYVQGEFAWG